MNDLPLVVVYGCLKKQVPDIQRKLEGICTVKGVTSERAAGQINPQAASLHVIWVSYLLHKAANNIIAKADNVILHNKRGVSSLAQLIKEQINGNAVEA